MEKHPKKPFMWEYVSEVDHFDDVTSGEERRPFTASSNEENNSEMVAIINN